MVRARSGSSTPRHPRTIRSLSFSCRRNRQWPSRPRLEQLQDECRSRPLHPQQHAVDRGTPAPRPATHAGAGRRSAGRPMSRARWAAPYPAWTTPSCWQEAPRSSWRRRAHVAGCCQPRQGRFRSSRHDPRSWLPGRSRAPFDHEPADVFARKLDALDKRGGCQSVDVQHHEFRRGH